jgi:hypothetical protein
MVGEQDPLEIISGYAMRKGKWRNSRYQQTSFGARRRRRRRFTG